MKIQSSRKKKIGAVLGATALAMSLGVPAFAAEASTELYAPDCSPCHGDAHTPGEENPHGYDVAGAVPEEANTIDSEAAKAETESKDSHDQSPMVETKDVEEENPSEKGSSETAKSQDLEWLY